MNTKTGYDVCIYCFEERQLYEFERSDGRGRRPRCIKCNREYMRDLKRKSRDKMKKEQINQDDPTTLRRKLTEEILIYPICDVCGYDKHPGSITIVDADCLGLEDMIVSRPQTIYQDLPPVLHQCVSMCLNCEQMYNDGLIDRGPMPTIKENIDQDRLAQYVSSIMLD